MAQQNEWWDVGRQFQRASNAFANHHGMAGSVKANPDEYDFWGNKKATTPNNSATYAAVAKAPSFQQTFDENGMVNGGQYLNEHGMVTGNQKVDIPGGAYKAPAPPPANPVSAYGQGVSANQARWDALYKQASSQKNPYADASAVQAALRQSDDNVSHTFANAKRQGQEDLAVRGMAGSGQEAGMMNALNASQASAYSSGRNAVQSQFADKSNAWQQNQNSAIMQALTGQYGAMGGYVTQARLPGELEGQGIQNETARAQLRIYAQQANMDEATYTERLKAKKQEYELALINGEAQIWEAENAYWLKPLEALAPVAGRALGRVLPLNYLP
jgi:hypothetical protein